MMKTSNLKLLKLFVGIQIILFLGISILWFLREVSYKPFLIIVPILMWLFLFIGITKEKYGYITCTLYLLIFYFVYSIICLIRDFNYFTLFVFLHYCLFMVLFRKAFVD